MGTFRNILTAAIILLSVSFNGAAQVNELGFSKILPEKFDKNNIIEEKDYNVWGTNILKGKDGKFHAIYPRFRKCVIHPSSFVKYPWF